MHQKLFILLLVAFLALSAACGKPASQHQADVVILDDGHRETREIYIDESNFQSKPTHVSTATENSKGETRLLADRSRIVTMFDGFGNKTETRYFENDARLKLVVLRTSADGQKRVTVYGHGSDTKTVNELGEKVLTASSDEIANIAGMFATKSDREFRDFTKQGQSTTSALKPLPSSEFPVAQPQVEPVETQNDETSTPDASVKVENQPTDQPEIPQSEVDPGRLLENQK